MGLRQEGLLANGRARTFDLDGLPRLDLSGVGVHAVALRSGGLDLVDRQPVGRAVGQPQPEQLPGLLPRACAAENTQSGQSQALKEGRLGSRSLHARAAHN
jgi:hypothetical protein